MMQSAKPQQLRILHLAAADHGGAGIAAVRLHEALSRAGAHSRMVVLSHRSLAPGVAGLGPQGLSARAKRFAARAFTRLTTRTKYFFQNQRLSLAAGTNLEREVVPYAPDLIVVHAISNFLSFEDVARLHRATGARVVWNLLDMAPLTGGCHYSWDCPGYVQGCGNCPALPLRPANDVSAKTIREKAAALVGTDHVVVAASSTLQRQAAASMLFRGSEIRTIHIGLDPAAFPAIGRRAARERLGLPSEGPILFFGAQSLAERRKGMHLLAEALKLLPSRLAPAAPLPMLLVAGDAAGFSGLKQTGFTMHQLGYVGRDKLALAYAAADFFLCPSIEDSGPMMINESTMAGTPVIAFSVGVVPDLVVSGESGVIASEKSSSAFADAIAQGLAWDERRLEAARACCRELATEKCSLEQQAAGILALAQPVARPAEAL